MNVCIQLQLWRQNFKGHLTRQGGTILVFGGRVCNTTVLSVYVNLQNFLPSKICNENWLLFSLTSAKVIVTKVYSTWVQVMLTA